MRYHDKIHTLLFVAPFVIRIFHTPQLLTTGTKPHQSPASQPALSPRPANQPTIHQNATTPPPQPHEHVHTRPASLLVYTVPTPPYPSLTAHTPKRQSTAT